jgi:hypothetical protein
MREGCSEGKDKSTRLLTVPREHRRDDSEREIRTLLFDRLSPPTFGVSGSLPS